jgi:hypothetical protein
MRLLVFGASGPLGRAITEAALAAGHQVAVGRSERPVAAMSYIRSGRWRAAANYWALASGHQPAAADMRADRQRRPHLSLGGAQHTGPAVGAVTDGQVRYRRGRHDPLAAAHRIPACLADLRFLASAIVEAVLACA